MIFIVSAAYKNSFGSSVFKKFLIESTSEKNAEDKVTRFIVAGSFFHPNPQPIQDLTVSRAICCSNEIDPIDITDIDVNKTFLKNK